jgi:RimJ/RimL family protein N-acetyltransferase
MAVLEKNTNSLVWVVGLYNIDWDLKIFYVGYWGVAEFSGNGYITESVKKLVDYVMENLKASRV